MGQITFSNYTLQNFPDELLENVFRNLKLKDLKALSQTCKRLNSFIRAFLPALLGVPSNQFSRRLFSQLMAIEGSFLNYRISCSIFEKVELITGNVLRVTKKNENNNISLKFFRVGNTIGKCEPVNIKSTKKVFTFEEAPKKANLPPGIIFPESDLRTAKFIYNEDRTAGYFYTNTRHLIWNNRGCEEVGNQYSNFTECTTSEIVGQMFVVVTKNTSGLQPYIQIWSLESLNCLVRHEVNIVDLLKIDEKGITLTRKKNDSTILSFISFDKVDFIHDLMDLENEKTCFENRYIVNYGSKSVVLYDVDNNYKRIPFTLSLGEQRIESIQMADHTLLIKITVAGNKQRFLVYHLDLFNTIKRSKEVQL